MRVRKVVSVRGICGDAAVDVAAVDVDVDVDVDDKTGFWGDVDGDSGHRGVSGRVR